MYKADYPEWYKKWQNRFYTSKRWIKVRDAVRDKKRMRCEVCGKLIRGRSIVDHKIEITPENYTDEKLLTGEDNLMLMCIVCHNKKTFAAQMDYRMEKRNDVNLF